MNITDLCYCVLVVLITFGGVLVCGFGLGYEIADCQWTNLCEDANVKLVRHKTVVDGVVATNWVECVHLN